MIDSKDHPLYGQEDVSTNIVHAPAPMGHLIRFSSSMTNCFSIKTVSVAEFCRLWVLFQRNLFECLVNKLNVAHLLSTSDRFERKQHQ